MRFLRISILHNIFLTSSNVAWHSFNVLLSPLTSLTKYNSLWSISNSYSNGFFVKNCLKNFDDNQLLLDYSGLNNLDDNIRRNIEDVCIVIPKIKTRGDDK